jgi:hypothetical protein
VRQELAEVAWYLREVMVAANRDEWHTAGPLGADPGFMNQCRKCVGAWHLPPRR